VWRCCGENRVAAQGCRRRPLTILEQGLGIDDHFASILQNIFIVYGIRLRIVECPVRVVGMSRRLGVYESGVIGGLPVRTRAVRRGRGWE
jgi:hypothetical protein